MAANPEGYAASAFLQRLTSYPLVKYTYDVTLHYYNEAKEKNSLIKKGLEIAETSVGTVAASPLVQNVGKSWEPLLIKADQFGCSQLDKAEVTLFKPAVQLYTTANATIASSKKIVEEKVATSKKLVEEKVVQPISSTYQQLVSLPGALTNKVFDFAEDSVDYYLPDEGETEKDESLAHFEEGPANSQETTTNTQTVWARGSKLSRRAYHRAQRRAARRARIAKVYAEGVITKSPLATTTVNYIRNRDPETRDTLIQQVKTTITYYSDKTKGFLAERPLVNKAASFVQPYLANLSYQSFYAVLLTFLATVSSAVHLKRHDTQRTTSSSSSSSSDSPAPSSDDDEEPEESHAVLIDHEHEDNDTSGPAEPELADGLQDREEHADSEPHEY